MCAYVNTRSCIYVCMYMQMCVFGCCYWRISLECSNVSCQLLFVCISSLRSLFNLKFYLLICCCCNTSYELYHLTARTGLVSYVKLKAFLFLPTFSSFIFVLCLLFLLWYLLGASFFVYILYLKSLIFKFFTLLCLH